MPRRSLLWMFAVAVSSFACYVRADHNPYGRYFSQIVGHIQSSYVEPVDEQQLFNSAVEGMVRRLDEYSSFIPIPEATQFEEMLGQKFGGLGIEVSLDAKKRLIVMTPLVGTPAYAAGISAGDQILAIDGQSTEGFSLEDTVKILRGKPGEPVTLRIVHAGETTPVDYTIVRALINVSSVLGDGHLPDGQWNFMLDPAARIGYLRITSFGEQTAEETRDALAMLQRQNFRALVLDLRNNPGGLLESAAEVCDLFMQPNRLIVSTRGRDGRVRQEHFSHGGPYRSLPLVVLTNRYSASAAEIVAACLQDHGRAVIIGERTYGKGTVQSVIPVEGGRSILKLTTATYWRPSGKNIHRLKQNQASEDWGVRPDKGFEMPLADEQFTRWIESRRQRDVIKPPTAADSAAPKAAEPFDPQLDRAREYLQKKLRAEKTATR